MHDDGSIIVELLSERVIATYSCFPSVYSFLTEKAELRVVYPFPLV